MMKTRVNLYQAEFHPKLRLLTLSIAIIAWSVTALFFVAMYSYLTFEQNDLKTEFANAQQKQQQQAALIKTLEQELNGRGQDPKLQQVLEKNQRLLRLKKNVLKELAGQEELKSGGFSELMLDLASQHQSGLWLTHIGLDGKNVVLEGEANESSIIPKWVNTLGQTDYFTGQEFAETRLYRDEDQQLKFVLTSGKENESAGALVNE